MFGGTLEVLDFVFQTHALKWLTYKDFEQTCGLGSPQVSTMESEMHTCLKDGESKFFRYMFLDNVA